MSDVTEIKMSLVKHSTSFLSPFVDQNLWLSVNKVFKTVHYVFIHHFVLHIQILSGKGNVLFNNVLNTF